jgi:organic radical activating enzyme
LKSSSSSKLPGLDEKQKTALENGILLPVMEEFYSLQGEGYHTGRAAYFIRIGGCDVGCHWCDVKESWNAKLHPPTSIEEIIKRASSYPAKSVVLTGGEPALYDLLPLCEGLHANGVEIFLETSGAYKLNGIFDWICLSPKKQLVPTEDIYTKANELKVIISEDDDFDWAISQGAKVRSGCKLFLQPEWSRVEVMMPKIVEFIMQHPQWQMSLQSHKYMHIP